MKQETDIITFDQLYRDCTLKALNRTRTAAEAGKLLGVSERTVLRWKKTYGIHRDSVDRKYYFIEG